MIINPIDRGVLCAQVRRAVPFPHLKIDSFLSEEFANRVVKAFPSYNMAAHYIDRIRSVQPRGPYLVEGMCAGSVIAFEIARQLQSRREEVALLALIDAADLTATPKAWHVTSQRIHGFSSVFHQDRSVSFHRRVSSVLSQASRKVTNLSNYLVGRGLKELRDEIRMRRFRAYLDRGWSIPQSLEQIPVRTVYRFADSTGTWCCSGRLEAMVPTNPTSSAMKIPCSAGAGARTVLFGPMTSPATTPAYSRNPTCGFWPNRSKRP
jgi:hypothetical protein